MKVIWLTWPVSITTVLVCSAILGKEEYYYLTIANTKLVCRWTWETNKTYKKTNIKDIFCLVNIYIHKAILTLIFKEIQWFPITLHVFISLKPDETQINHQSVVCILKL